MQRNFYKADGFTLVELILYISILGILLLAIFYFTALAFEIKAKNQSIMDIETQGEFAMRIITQTIRNAVSINTPTTSAFSTSLSLTVSSTANSPTIFSVSTGTLFIKEGAQNPVALTNSYVTVTGTIFYNLTRPSTPGNIKINFTLDHYNPSNQNEYAYTKNFYGTASLRK